MGFSKDQLLPGEVLVLQRHQSLIVLLRAILLNVVAAAIVGALAFYFQNPWPLLGLIPTVAVLLWEMLARRRKEYIITSRRVVKQEGIFAVHSFDAPLDKINNIFHEQNFVGRLFGFGSVGLETASEQGTTVFHYLPDPVAFKNAIAGQREAYSSRAGGVAIPAPSRENIPRMLDELASLRDRKIITEREFEQKKKELLEKL